MQQSGTMSTEPSDGPVDITPCCVKKFPVKWAAFTVILKSALLFTSVYAYNYDVSRCNAIVIWCVADICINFMRPHSGSHVFSNGYINVAVSTLCMFFIELVWVMLGIVFVANTQCASIAVRSFMTVLLIINAVYLIFMSAVSLNLCDCRKSCLMRPELYAILNEYGIDRYKLQSDTTFCYVCYYNIEQNTDVVRLSSCGHVYHAACASTFLGHRLVCPECAHNRVVGASV